MRMAMRTAALGAGLILLAGCDAGGGVAETDAAADAVMLESAAPSPGAAVAPETPSDADDRAPAPAPQMAYAYTYVLETALDRTTALMRRHEQACLAAGPAACQVIGARSEQRGRDNVWAQLEMRATPAHVARFRAAAADDAREAGGRVVSESVDSEDLTRNLSDTTARLNALTTLRDRLQQLLATRSGTLEQLLQVERELARVQGELDATRSALETMRTRVATSRLTVSYQSAGQMAPDSAFRPVQQALDNALTVFMTMVGALILLLAGLLPVLLIAAPLAWLGLRARRRARTRKAVAAPPADPAGS